MKKNSQALFVLLALTLSLASAEASSAPETVPAVIPSVQVIDLQTSGLKPVESTTITRERSVPAAEEPQELPAKAIAAPLPEKALPATTDSELEKRVLLQLLDRQSQLEERVKKLETKLEQAPSAVDSEGADELGEELVPSPAEPDMPSTPTSPSTLSTPIPTPSTPATPNLSPLQKREQMRRDLQSLTESQRTGSLAHARQVQNQEEVANLVQAFGWNPLDPSQSIQNQEIKTPVHSFKEYRR